MHFRDGQSRILNQSYHRENKFHQYGFTIHLHFGSVVQVLTNSAVLVSFHSRVALYFVERQVSILEKRMRNSLNCWREWKFVFLEQAVVRVSCGNPGSRHGKVLGRGIVEGWLGTWVVPELLTVSGSQNSLASDKELLCSVNLEFESTVDSRRIPLLMHGQFINSCLSCSICFFATNSSQFFNFLAIFCLISRKSLFLISNSPYELILLFLSWSARWFACCSCNRWDSNFWLIS